MIYSEFTELIKTLDFPVYECDFPKSKSNPIVVYQKGIEQSVSADVLFVFNQTEVIIHLVTDRKDVTSQPKLEAWLKENDFNFKLTDRFWDKDNSFYITEYRFYIL